MKGLNLSIRGLASLKARGVETPPEKINSYFSSPKKIKPMA